MSETNKHLVRRHFEEIFNRRDLGACDTLMAETFVEHAAAPFAPAAPGRVHGPQAMRGTAAGLLAQFPDLRMTIEAVVAEADLVVARVRMEGTNLGTFDGGPPPTGKRFVAAQCHWFRVADGQLVEHWATRDDLSAMLQLGIIQPPGRPPS